MEGESSPEAALPACPFLRECVERHQASALDLDALLDGVDEAAANRKPASDRWSALECLEHVRVSEELYFPYLERAIARGQDEGITGAAPYGKGTFIGRMILSVLEPREELKPVKAPKVFRPAASNLVLAHTADAVRRANARLRGLALAADGLDLGRLRIRTPILPWPRITLAETFRIHALHEARHLAQAARALA